ncbi:MAG: beta-lactamase family protein [Actinobacteria bacterium]|nr:beta-lactamase family protein [Actinomycetota bacterium]
MSIDQVLRQIDDWPAPEARVAVVGPKGIIAHRGAIEIRSRWASVSKLLTAFAILMAVQDEELSLDDLAGPAGSTVRHLLAHTSGLPFEGEAPVARPGARRIYSNTGFDLLGDKVGEATGDDFDDYLRWQVLEPLTMEVDIVGRPSAGLSGSLLDMTVFAQELLTPTLLDPSRLRAGTTVAFPGLAGIIPGLGRYDPCDWGLGFEIRDGKSPHWTGNQNSPATYGHFGGSGSFLWVDSDRQLAMCGLSGRAFDDEDWAMKFWPPLFDGVLSQVG